MLLWLYAEGLLYRTTRRIVVVRYGLWSTETCGLVCGAVCLCGGGETQQHIEAICSGRECIAALGPAFSWLALVIKGAVVVSV